jgi:hypothetical protein
MSEGIQRDPPSVIIRYDDQCAQETGQDMWLVRKSPHCLLYGVGRLRIVASGKRDSRADHRIRDGMRERGHQLVAEVAFVKVGDIGSAVGAQTRIVGNDSPACGTERRHGASRQTPADGFSAGVISLAGHQTATAASIPVRLYLLTTNPWHMAFAAHQSWTQGGGGPLTQNHVTTPSIMITRHATAIIPSRVIFVA